MKLAAEAGRDPRTAQRVLDGEGVRALVRGEATGGGEEAEDRGESAVEEGNVRDGKRLEKERQPGEDGSRMAWRRSGVAVSDRSGPEVGRIELERQSRIGAEGI